MSENRTVYKYVLPAEVSEVDMPVGGIVRLVGTDPASGMPAVWVEHALGSLTESRTFRIVGTGGFVEPGSAHLGSTIADHFVWHVYERLAPTSETAA